MASLVAQRLTDLSPLLQFTPAYFLITPLAFRRKGTNFVDSLAFVVSFLTAFGFQLKNVLQKPTSSKFRKLLSSVLHVSAVSLWGWTSRTTSSKKLSYVMANDTPEFLHQSGPFKYVRHPFYTSYITTFAAMALATENQLSGWACTSLVAALYWAASKREEAKFAKSRLAGVYAAYKKRTGAFFPKGILPPL